MFRVESLAIFCQIGVILGVIDVIEDVTEFFTDLVQALRCDALAPYGQNDLRNLLGRLGDVQQCMGERVSPVSRWVREYAGQPRALDCLAKLIMNSAPRFVMVLHCSPAPLIASISCWSVRQTPNDVPTLLRLVHASMTRSAIARSASLR